MRRRNGYHGYYGRRRLRAAARYDYRPGRRTALLPAGGAVVVLLVLAAILVFASLI